MNKIFAILIGTFIIPVYAANIGTVIFNKSSDSLWTFCSPSGISNILEVGQSGVCGVNDTAIQVANIGYQPSCMDCHNQTAGDFSFGPKTAESYYGSLPPVPGGDAGTIINFHNIGAGNLLTITGTPGVDIPNAMTFAKSVAPLADFDMYSSTIHVSNATAYPLEFLCEPSSTFYTVNAESGSYCPSYGDNAIYIGYNVDPSHIQLGGVINNQGGLPDNAPSINPGFTGQLGSGHSWLLNNLNGLDANIYITGDPNNTVTMRHHLLNQFMSLTGGIRIVNTTQYPMDVVCVPNNIMFEVAPGSTKYCPSNNDNRAFIGFNLPTLSAIEADSNVVRHQSFPNVNVTENITGGMGNQKAWDLEGISGFDTLIISGDPTSQASNAITMRREQKLYFVNSSKLSSNLVCSPSGVYSDVNGGSSINVEAGVITSMVGGAALGATIGIATCTAVFYAITPAVVSEWVLTDDDGVSLVEAPAVFATFGSAMQACLAGVVGGEAAGLSIGATISGMIVAINNAVHKVGISACYYDDTAIYEGTFNGAQAGNVQYADNLIYGDIGGATVNHDFISTWGYTTDDYAVKFVNFQNLTHRVINKYCSEAGDTLGSCNVYSFDAN